MKANSYVPILWILFRINFDGIFLRCLPPQNAQGILKEKHEGSRGGHFSPQVTAICSLRTSFYWPTIFKDSYAMVKRFLACQFFFG